MSTLILGTPPIGGGLLFWWFDWWFDLKSREEETNFEFNLVPGVWLESVSPDSSDRTTQKKDPQGGVVPTIQVQGPERMSELL